MAGASGPAYDPSAVILFAAMTTQPDDSWKAAADALIVGLKADGIWSQLDWLNLLACRATDGTSANSQGSLLNAHAPAKSLTAVNSPTFSALGVTGDAATSYLDYNEVANAAGNVFALNSAMYFGYTNQANGVAGVRVILGTTATQRATLNTRSTAGNLTFRANDQTDSTGATGQTSRLGSRAWARSASTTKRFYVDGVETAALAVASTTVSAGNMSALRDVATYSGDRLALIATGGGLSATDIANLHSRALTFLTAIGAN
jgi:hypothetical protein